MKKRQERKLNKSKIMKHTIAEVLPNQKNLENVQADVVSRLSNPPSINGLSFIYRKAQATAHTLTKLGELVTMCNQIKFSDYPSYYIHNVKNVMELSTKLDQEENKVISRSVSGDLRQISCRDCY